MILQVVYLLIHVGNAECTAYLRERRVFKLGRKFDLAHLDIEDDGCEKEDEVR
jgi:hypothetical protein